MNNNSHPTGEPFGGTPTYLVLDAGGALRSYRVGPTTEAQLAELVASDAGSGRE